MSAYLRPAIRLCVSFASKRRRETQKLHGLVVAVRLGVEESFEAVDKSFQIGKIG